MSCRMSGIASCNSAEMYLGYLFRENCEDGAVFLAKQDWAANPAC